MVLASNYKKFIGHFKSGGLSYAAHRGIKYFIFVIKRTAERYAPKFKPSPEPSIERGKVKIAYRKNGLSIFYDGCLITRNTGLNVAINSFGQWSNFTGMRVEFSKKGDSSLKVEMTDKTFRIKQTWVVKIEDNNQISWQINLGLKRPMHIDEVCISCFVNPRYKEWVNGNKQRNFPIFNSQWQDLCLDDNPTRLLGVRFSTEEESLPSLVFEFRDNDLLPFVKTSPSEGDMHVIGVRHTQYKAKEKCDAGNYDLFAGKICLFESDMLFNARIQKVNRDFSIPAIAGRSRPRAKVLLANLPWQKHGKLGVRAGSRWPHIRDKSEGDYVPFPFFLAYATALLQKNGVDVTLIDAIAGEISEDKFLGIISSGDFDYLVAETSIPSFGYDLKLLEKISRLGISIVLCGPNSEIYQTEFLQKNNFIRFVLCGEYEFNLLDLITRLRAKEDLSKVKGLIYRDNGKVKKILSGDPFDMNLLPWPHRETLPMRNYLDAPGGMDTPSAQMMASRGCPFKCQFCLWPQVIYQGCRYRARDVKDVIDEMEYLVKEKKFKSVYFDDDTFNIGRKRMLDLCGEIKKRGLNNIQWAIMARPDLMDEKLLVEFKNAGLYAVKYGVESAVQDLVDKIDKGMSLKKAEKMIRFTNKIGIKTHLTFTFGLPGENKYTIAKTVKQALSLNPFSVQFSILTPFPGTKYHEILESQGRIASKDFSHYDGHYKSVIKTDTLSPVDLESAKTYAYKAWAEHLTKKAGFYGNIKKFFQYTKNKGLLQALRKTMSYVKFILCVKYKPVNFERKLLLKENVMDDSYKRAMPSMCEADDSNKAVCLNMKLTHILLVQCPPWDVAMPPLGIAYLASSLKAHGYKASVFDLNATLYNTANENSRFLWEQRSFNWWVDENLFKNTFAMLEKDIDTFIDSIFKEEDMKCIGLSVNFAGIKFAAELIKIIRLKNSNIKIIVGGWATSDAYMRSLLPNDLIDVFVIGEAEETILEVMDVLWKGKIREIPGAIFTKDRPHRYTPRMPVMNLDRIPWPTFEEFSLELYKHPILPLFTSRGCISRCKFCNDWPFSKPYRFRSAENIFDEIKFHVENKSVTVFSFKDLLCNGNLMELDSLCDLIIDSGLKINWDSQAIARKEMTYEFLCKLRKAGCGSLIYGVESFSDSILQNMGKLFTRDVVTRVLKDTHRAGITALINIIVGFPGETHEDFQETMRAIEQNRKYIAQIGAISVCLVNGNSELDLNCKDYGIRLSSDARIRAKKWNSVDGKNTYDIRKRRADEVIAMINQLGISYDTATV